MSEKSILATIPQEVNKFKDAVFATYGVASPLVLCYDIDETDLLNPKVTFRFFYLNSVQRFYTHYLPYLQSCNINYILKQILKQGVLDLIEYLESHINDETSTDFQTYICYNDAIEVLEKNLGISPNVFLEYDTISGYLTVSALGTMIAHCNNPTNLNRLPYELQVQVLYESMIQAMIEPLQKIYDKLCM